jgi:hypothetical protein
VSSAVNTNAAPNDRIMTEIDEDQRAGWAEICAGFHRIRLEANRLGFRPRWQALVRTTITDARSLADWRNLAADISQSDEVDEDFAGRHGGSDKLVRGLRGLLTPDAETETEYECPKALCSRRAVSSTGAPPRCDLLSLEMQNTATASRALE